MQTLSSNLETKKYIPSNMYTLKIILVIMSIVMGIKCIGDKKTWTYELKSITSRTSDSEKFKCSLEIKRVSRGTYAISGEVLFNYDIVQGDSNNVAAKCFRSTQGDGDYKILPFQVPEGHFYKIINSYYKDLIMDSLKDCSDMPVFEDQFVPPLEKKTYKFDACQFSQDGFPNHLQEGFYKISITGTGDVEWNLELFFEIISDI